MADVRANLPNQTRETRTLEDIAQASSGFIGDGDWIESKDQDPDGDVRLIQLADIGDGRFKNASDRWLSFETAERLNCTYLERGDILVARMPDPIGRAAIYPGFEYRSVTAVDVCIIRVGNAVCREWLAQLLNSPSLRWRMNELAGGGTRQRVSTREIRALCLHEPPLEEQRKIAEILRTWDEAIETLEALRSAKEKLTSAIADDLIFGVRRVAGKQKPWPSRRLAEVTRELTRRNRDEAIGRDLVMGVTNSRGIVPMREQTIAADISRYLILPPRAFAYNPMRINVGSIAMSRFEHNVLVSPDYVLFECLPGKLDPDFLDHLRQSHFWSHYINAGGTGSVRMRTYYDDLAALRLKIPPYEEQLAISEVLNTAQREVRLIEDQIAALSRQKRGLMQKLLTGEWRTKVNGDKGVAA